MIHIIQSSIGRCVIASHYMLITVIISGVICTNNRHGHINRVDGLVTIRHIEGNSCEVSVSIGELISGQTHVRCTGSSSRC